MSDSKENLVSYFMSVCVCAQTIMCGWREELVGSQSFDTNIVRYVLCHGQDISNTLSLYLTLCLNFDLAVEFLYLDLIESLNFLGVP